MANAGFGLPVELTLHTESAAPDRPWSNVLNDEPGLVYSDQVSSGSSVSITLNTAKNLGSSAFLCVLGLDDDAEVSLKSYANASDRESDTNATDIFTGFAGLLSSNSSNKHRKFFRIFDAANRQDFRFIARQSSGQTQDLSFWRVLLGDWIEPQDNIEIRAQSLIDDRQRRQFAITGRRNFFDTGVFPGFSGKWPWLTRTEYQSQIRPMSLRYGASKPVVFCLDYEDNSWGEDELYYGDLEKDQPLTHDDAELFDFGFTIVDIAAVDPVD